MTVPLLLQFVSTIYKWFQLEKRESKKWSWPMLLLQCWPQWRAIRIMHLDLRNDKKAEEKKKEVMRELTTTEPFLEAWPSIVVMTVIWLIAMYENTSYDDYCNEHQLWPWQNDTYNNRTWTCEPTWLDLPPQYCEIKPEDNNCAVFSGFGGSTGFFISYAISIISASFGITKFLQNGPFAEISTDGLLGGIMNIKFIIAFFSVLTSIVTKCLFIPLLVILKLVESEVYVYPRIIPWIREAFLIRALLISFAILILPNLVFSLISISCSTGLNLKLLKVISNYPASWMLPIATYFTIGPYKPNCCSQTNSNRNLGLSCLCSAVNMVLSLIMHVALISIFGMWEIWEAPLFMVHLPMWPVVVIGIVLQLYILTYIENAAVQIPVAKKVL